MDIQIGDIWEYGNRDFTYWLIYDTKDNYTYLLSKVGGEINTVYRKNDFIGAKHYWRLVLRVK